MLNLTSFNHLEVNPVYISIYIYIYKVCEKGKMKKLKKVDARRSSGQRETRENVCPSSIK